MGTLFQVLWAIQAEAMAPSYRSLHNKKSEKLTKRMTEAYCRQEPTFFFFMAVLGLCCCTRAFSSCGESGLLFVEVQGLLIVVASLVVEHKL